MKSAVIMTLMLAVGFAHVQAADSPPANSAVPAILPLPVKMELGTGMFTVGAGTVIVADAASSATARQLVDYLKPAMGFALSLADQAPAGDRSVITLAQDQKLSSLGKEGYRLTVSAKSIQVLASTQAGLFYGVQTLRQLLPPQIFSAAPAKDIAWTVPCVTIEDTPRFAWRGLMLDTGHDFQKLPFVYRFVDLMVLHKFNTFHWHITDLGTWPLEIKGYPKLQDPSTRRKGVKPGSYTQDEIRELVKYAAARHITVVPEVDMPGHSIPALIAYPELDCPVPDPGNPGISPFEYCVGNEKTYAFLETVLTQVVELFPSTYIHIGGDECPKGHWQKCPVCQAKMKAENLKNEMELQSYFIKRIEKFINAKGRRMIGWDEILEGGLAPNATVMSWRGMAGGIAAAKAGHDVVMAPTAWTYFDYPNTPVAKVYSFEPVPKELAGAQAAHILGAQAQMWTDRHPSEDNIDALVYPRAVALSEVVWSPAASRNYDGFLERLQGHLPRLAALGVRYKPLSVTKGTELGRWTSKETSPTPKVVDWPITVGVTGPGRYEISFRYFDGKSRYQIHAVQIVQDGKVLAEDQHFGWTGASDKDNVYQVNLPRLATAPLILRATVSTDSGPDSNGRILIAKIP